MTTTSIDKKIRRKVRKKRSALIKGSQERPRVVLSESNRYLRVQAIDDTVGNTLASASTKEFNEQIHPPHDNRQIPSRWTHFQKHTKNTYKNRSQ